MTLAEARVRECVEITGVVVDDDGRSSRLEDLGFLVGTSVRVDRRAALGDPTIYELRGTRIALRKADAALIEVTVSQPAR
jgi:Fe2+ transport system protein FeoA